MIGGIGPRPLIRWYEGHIASCVVEETGRLKVIRYQSAPRGMPSSGQMAFLSVVDEIRKKNPLTPRVVRRQGVT